jgi:hypothetical protein
MDRGGMEGGYGASSWNRGSHANDLDNRGYDHDWGDRVREGWENVRDRARNLFRR